MSHPARCDKAHDGQHTLAPVSVEHAGAETVKIHGKCLDCGRPGVMIVGGHVLTLWRDEGDFAIDTSPKTPRSNP